MKQEVFNWSFKTTVEMQEAIDVLIDDGYHVDAVSHCERSGSPAIKISCIIVATKTS